MPIGLADVDQHSGHIGDRHQRASLVEHGDGSGGTGIDTKVKAAHVVTSRRRSAGR
jgi:hypothetical protein